MTFDERLTALEQQWAWAQGAGGRVDALTTQAAGLDSRITKLEDYSVGAKCIDTTRQLENGVPITSKAFADNEQLLDQAVAGFSAQISGLKDRLDKLAEKLG